MLNGVAALAIAVLVPVWKNLFPEMVQAELFE
jgi:hypothetical protein